MTFLFRATVFLALVMGLATTLAYSVMWALVALGWVNIECVRFSEGPFRYLELWAEPGLLLAMVLVQLVALVWVAKVWRVWNW